MMETKVIECPLYRLEDGTPAYKAGEWEGSKPNHFGRTLRIIKQIRHNDNAFERLHHKPVFHRSSSEYIFRPCIKKSKIIYGKFN